MKGEEQMVQKTAIYIRTAPGTESADEQRDETFDYAANILGIDPADSLVLSDSGTDTRANESSGYNRLFDLADDGTIERVIMSDAARIATNMRDLSAHITRLVEAGVAVHIIDVGFHVGEGESDDQMALDLLGIAAEMESAVNRERTREGLAAAKAAGKHVGRPPFGFDADGDGGLVPNENFETALTVIEEIKAGRSVRSTARQAGISRATVGNITEQKDLYKTGFSETLNKLNPSHC
jgi:DNA invertase Pin-like site-specific DNA recombinase